jgi:AraC-like DNA-binding protein
MEEARWLLTTTDFSLQDTALMVGYENSAAFSRAFKRESGMPPGKFRNMKS